MSEGARGMLVLTRKPGEIIKIGENIEISLVSIEGFRQVRIGIKAPKEVLVIRKEAYIEGFKK